jgi:muconolactone delta-isomerase
LGQSCASQPNPTHVHRGDRLLHHGRGRDHEEKETARAFYVDGIIRHIWQQADGAGIVIIFEASSPEHMQSIVQAFPLVRAGYLDLTVVALEPYAGFGPHGAELALR